MTPAIISLIILAIMAFFFVTDKLPLALTSMLGAVVLVLAGILPKENLFSAFSGSTVVLLAAMMVIGSSLFHTGIAEKMSNIIVKVTGTSENGIMIATGLVATILSSICSGVAVVAMLLPIVIGISMKAGVSVSRQMIPLAFAASFGCNLTLVGAASNIVVNGQLESLGAAPLTFLELGKVGVPICIFGILYFLTIGKKALIQGDSSDKDYLLEFTGSADASSSNQFNSFKAILCLIILAAAVVMICVNGFGGKGALNLGIDFSSGTKITVTSNETLNTNEVRNDFEALGYKPSRVQASGDKVVYVTLNQALEQDQLTSIKETLTAKYGIEPNDNVVTPVVGRELVKNAIALSLLAWVAMLIYITIRFKWDYAVSCIVALVHDVAIVLAIFAIFRMEINIELISVILAIIGYSINNSIVVFDRVRESIAESRKPKLTNADYRLIVNDSLDKTLVRSVFSSITTLLPIIALLLMGSGAIVTFNFAMFVGLIAGTFSSIFIAPQMWYTIRTHVKPKEKKKKKVKKEKLDELTIPGIND